MQGFEAGAGLRWTVDPQDAASGGGEAGAVGHCGRVAWGSSDWLGPIQLQLAPEAQQACAVEPDALWPSEERESEDDLGAYRAFSSRSAAAPLRLEVRAYTAQPLLVFRIESTRALERLATGSFEQPSIAWPAAAPSRRAAEGLPPGTSAFGYLFAEFGLPSTSDPSLEGFLLLPEAQRPAVIMPLALLAPDGRALLLAPLDQFHEQIIAVPRGREQRELGLRCGWHGDLDRVPAGFASELAVWGADGLRRGLEQWGTVLKARHGTRRPSRYADAAVSRLSYWTDNGAAYWYRTHPGLDMSQTLERALSSVEAAAPIGAVELDSWFYPHEITRRVGDRGPDAVPPSGALRWEAREDVLPDGIPALRQRLRDKPLILHARHFSSQSPYFERFPAWIDDDRGHPRGPELMDALLRQAAEWGAIQVEHDWLVECFLGVRGLREEPGRAAAWQRALDASAEEHGLHLVWCMATPADFMQSVALARIAAIRTSGDYRYGLSSASLWCWFLMVNALARALGLWPFKDVFLSSAEGDGLDGDRHADVEALLSALSAGPVGLGDRIGRTDAERVLRTCRKDGILVKPDLPLAALDRCFRSHPHLSPVPLLAETVSRHPAGSWVYLVTLHAWREKRPIEYALSLRELGRSAAQGDFVVYDWRRKAVVGQPSAARIEERLDARDWRLRILCPLLPGACTLIGDPARYASMGDRRVRDVRPRPGGGIRCDVLGAAGERFTLRGYSANGVVSARLWQPTGSCALDFRHDPTSGLFDLSLSLDERGWGHLEVEC